MRIGLVACGGLDTTGQRRPPGPAHEVYDGPLFRARRRHVAAGCDRWFVLSPRYGLVAPEDLVEPESERLTDLPRAWREAWTAAVLAELDEVCGSLAGSVVELHAGQAFCDAGLEQGLLERAASVARPVRGLGQGKQLAWYRQQRGAGAVEGPVRASLDAATGDRAAAAAGTGAANTDHVVSPRRSAAAHGADD